jgi:tetratricopeptide (TPR) repeat protein
MIFNRSNSKILVFGITALAIAIFAESALADRSKKVTPSQKDAVTTTEDDKAKSIEDVESPIKPADISNAEKDELASALKKRSEPQLLKAAAVILSKNPSHVETLNALAVYYFEAKKFGMAKLLIKRALKDHPSEPALLNNLGVVYLAEGDLRLAIEQFRKSIAAKSDYRIGATNLASIYLEYHDYQRSLSPLEEGYKSSRTDLRRGDVSAIEIANNYALALMGVGENSKAGEVFTEIVATNSRWPVPYLNYAILLVEVQKKKNDAVRVLSKLKFMTDDREILRRVNELERKLE